MAPCFIQRPTPLEASAGKAESAHLCIGISVYPDKQHVAAQIIHFHSESSNLSFSPPKLIHTISPLDPS